MKVVVVTEKRLEELFEQFLARVFKNVNTQVHGAKVEAGTVQYHACHLKDAIKDAGLGI
jgi:hypothetical protein